MFKESDVMRKYIIENINDIWEWKIAAMIAGAPISLQRKYEMLTSLAQVEDRDKWKGQAIDEDKEESYAIYAAWLQAAFDAGSCKDNEFFTVEECVYEERIEDYESRFLEPAGSLEKAMEVIADEYGNGEDYDEEEERESMTFHEITKWSAKGNGRYEPVITYIYA